MLKADRDRVKERAEASEDDIAAMVKRRLMEDGIVVPMKPKGYGEKTPEPELPRPVETVYELAGTQYCADSLEEAVSAAGVFKPRSYEWTGSGRVYYKADRGEGDAPAVTERPVYDQAELKGYIAAKKLAADMNKRQKEADKAYDDAMEAVREVEDTVRSVVGTCQSRLDAAHRLEATWNEYTALSNGDKSIGLSFLVKNYGAGAVDDMMVLLGYEPATDEPREAEKEEK